MHLIGDITDGHIGKSGFFLVHEHLHFRTAFAHADLGIRQTFHTLQAIGDGDRKLS